jgi:Leucine-rich repeat (LRR) protein
MKNSIIKRIVLLAVVMIGITAGDAFSQSANRTWWNSLPPAWKKIIQQQELKGKDITPTDEMLEDIVNIKSIGCSGNKDITDLKPLARLRALEYIDCSNTNITSLSGIETLTNLRELNCSNNDNVNSLLPCQHLGNLEYINCGNTMVKSLAPLKGLTRLKKLDVHFCTVNNLSVISELRNLVYLNVAQNQSLYSLSGVEKLINLVELDCSETNLSDLSPLETMKALETLNVSNTKVTTLRSLQFIKTLKEVDCSDTRISAASLDYFFSHIKLSLLRGRNLEISQKQINDFTSSFTKKNTNCDVILTTK